VQEIMMSKIFGFLAGAMCGAIVGAVAVLLLTPESGGQLREQAKQRYNEMLAEGRKAAEQRRQEILNEFEAMKRGE
jgi:gas vesicle protein